MARGEGDAFKEDAAAGEEPACDAEETVQGSEKRMLQSVVEQFMGKETVRSPRPPAVCHVPWRILFVLWLARGRRSQVGRVIGFVTSELSLLSELSCVESMVCI